MFGAIVDAGLDVLFRLNPEQATKLVVDRATRRVRMHRPRPWVMTSAHPSWPGQFDRTHIARHLPEDTAARRQPSIDDLAEIFRRSGDAGSEVATPCPKGTTVLFMFLAQWFTDSFLRTFGDPSLFGRTDSNHEVDLCQIYGLTDEKTDMLRETGDGGPTHRLAFRDVNGEMWPPLLCKPDATGKAVLADRYAGDDDCGDDGQPRPDDEDDGCAARKRRIPPLHELCKIRRNVRRALPHATDAEIEKRLLTFHATGLDNGNGTLGYTAVNTLFLRAHNHLADQLWDGMKDKGWDRERVFQTTRCILIASLIKIVFEDYMTHISARNLKLPVGYGDKAAWSRPNRIAIEFNLLYRWHPMVPATLSVDGRDLEPPDFRWNPALAEKIGLEPLIRAFSGQTAGRIALGNMPGFMLPDPNRPDPNRPGPSPFAATVQLARRAKLMPLNAHRRAFGLDPHRSFADLVGRQPGAAKLAGALGKLYDKVDDVEFFPGLFAEAHGATTFMGETMLRMVAYDAFTQLLTNPLMSKNLHTAETFSALGLRTIQRTSKLSDLARLVLPGLAPGDCVLGRRR